MLRKTAVVCFAIFYFVCLAAQAADPTEVPGTKAGRAGPVPQPAPPKPTPPPLPAPRPTPPTPPAKAPVDPLVQANAKRNQAMNHLKELAMAIQLDETVNKQLTQRAIFDKDGKPLLSWRVRMLPYLEGAALYKEFHLDEPWDSENNKKLLEKMPEVYKDPQIDTGAGTTVFQAVVGSGMAFEADKPLKFSDITDGTANTIAIVEVAADKAAPWTRPADWEIDPKNPAKGLAALDPGSRFLALYLDGHVEVVPTIGPTDQFRTRFTRNAGDNLNPASTQDKFNATKSH